MKSFLSLLTSAVLLTPVHAQSPPVIDLAGEWKLALDAGDTGLSAGPSGWKFNDTIELPNTLTRAEKGEPLKMEVKLDKESFVNLHQRHSYVGPAWYQREFDIPAEWSEMDVEIELERVLWESRIWINGEEAGMRDSLSIPHRYEIATLLKSGKNTVTLRIDNREKLPIGIGHAYTNATQTIWNGVVGKIELTARPKVRIESMRLRPQPEGKLSIALETVNTTGEKFTASPILEVTDPNGKSVPAEAASIEISPGSTSHSISIDLGSTPTGWSEFDPSRYTVKASIDTTAGVSEISDTFGYRIFEVDGLQFTNNGNPVFLRGSVDCSIFPKTGHPDMTGVEWEKIFTTAQAHGLNHIRFHSWCPPEIAFEIADKVGIYLQVEPPNWSFKMGKIREMDAYFQTEGERILKEYGNHPSFVMFSLGNELAGELPTLDKMVAHLKALDPEKLHTSTTYAFSPRGLLPGPNDDFFVSQQTKSGWVRGQGFLNETFPSTDTDYAEGLSSIEIPLVTHEVGQYVVYPNVAELPKYEGGPLRSTALEAIQTDLTAKGLIADAPRFTRDSGKLAALLYKEDVERALRTKDLAGIQLLQLNDFPGQSTATVGLLDAFWDSKGLITPEEFRAFSGSTVPLVRMKKMVWENDETFTANAEIAHFGAATLEGVKVLWKLGNAAKGEFEIPEIPRGNGISLGEISAELSGITEATKLLLEVAIADTDIRNSWPVWVYPVAEPEVEDTAFQVHRGVTEKCLADLEEGKSVLLLPTAETIKKPLPARFIPVFWSPLHFPNQPGSLGATIDSDHALWKNFPTDTHTNWQWWELTATSTAINLTGVDPSIAKPFRFIDKFDRNALPAAIFEAKVGSGKLLVCSLDVSTDLESRIVARQLRRALNEYITSTAFDPEGNLTPVELSQLIGTGTEKSDAKTEKQDDVRELGIVPGFNDQEE